MIKKKIKILIALCVAIILVGCANSNPNDGSVSSSKTGLRGTTWEYNYVDGDWKGSEEMQFKTDTKGLLIGYAINSYNNTFTSEYNFTYNYENYKVKYIIDEIFPDGHYKETGNGIIEGNKLEISRYSYNDSTHPRSRTYTRKK